MQDFFGQLDFTLLCRLWREHKELFQMVDFKDGKHAILKTNFNARQQADDHGNTHYLQAACKKDERKQGLSYYLGNFRPSTNNSQTQQQPAQQSQANAAEDLPF